MKPGAMISIILLKKTSGQNLAEFALLLAVISAAILGMQLYLQRSFQARLKAAGPDYLSSTIEQEAANTTNLTNFTLEQQYDPYYATSNMTESKNNTSSIGFPRISVQEESSRSGWQKTGTVADAD